MKFIQEAKTAKDSAEGCKRDHYLENQKWASIIPFQSVDDISDLTGISGFENFLINCGKWDI